MTTEWTCLLVDLDGTDLAVTWPERAAGVDFGVSLSVVQSVDEAQSMLNGGIVLVQVIFSRTFTPEVQTLLKAHQSAVGCLGEFQALVCDDPDPSYMAGAFEFGVEQFLASGSWPEEVAVITRRAIEAMADPESPESRTVNLTQSIRSADQNRIKAATEGLGELPGYDYRVAFAKGKACEATGDFGGAIKAFESASGMNRMFRPSESGLGESLLITGRVDEALAVFRKLEKTNPYDVERKANIASAYIEKGDFDSAKKYVEAAEKLAAGHSRVLEARAQVLLCTGQINEAFTLMDSMSEVGPFFAAKLNELGIQLSQAGKGKSALALYQKAHKIVRPELRYKISLNAALACRRLGAWEMALKYLSRCQKEYGGSFPKLEKIREAVQAMRQQQAAKPAAQAPADDGNEPGGTGGGFDQAG